MITLTDKIRLDDVEKILYGNEKLAISPEWID